MTYDLGNKRMLTVRTCEMDFASGTWTISFTVRDKLLGLEKNDRLTFDRMSFNGGNTTPFTVIDALRRKLVPEDPIAESPRTCDSAHQEEKKSL